MAAALGYDPVSHDVETILAPAEDLKKVYMLAGLGYNKSVRHTQRTVSRLDYAEIYLNHRSRIDDPDRLMACIDEFLS